MNPETRIKNSILLALGQEKDVLIWNQPTGVFRALEDPSRRVRVGTPGQADLMAVVQVEVTPEMVGKKIGVAWAIEVKTENGRLRADQCAWRDAIQRRGGHYDVIRSPLAAVDELERFRLGFKV